VKFAFILAQKALYPIAVLCDCLGVSRSGYYEWLSRPKAPRVRADIALTAHVRAVHARSQERYGSPRVHAELRAKGHRIGKKRVERLMRENGLQAKRRRRFRSTTDSKHTNPVAPNRVARVFETGAPNQVWVTDVTAVWTLAGWIYLAAILDLYSRRIVGFTMSANNDTKLALSALYRALRERRPAPGLVHHSDRGSPYASAEYRAVLEAHEVASSMSRKGDCWDNAVAESFFSTIKAELIEHNRYATHEDAMQSISDYIDRFYNVERRHSFLGYLSPIEFELRSLSRQQAA
jgi:putative transposase